MRVLAFTLMILMVFSGPVGAQGITDLRQALNESEQELLELQNSVERHRKNADKLSADIAAKQQKLTKLKQTIDTANGEVTETSQQVNDLEHQLEAVHQQIVEEQESFLTVEKSYVDSFKIVLENQKSFWQVFLNKLSWHDLLKENALMDYLAFSSGKAYAMAQEESKALLELHHGLELTLKKYRLAKETTETHIMDLKTGYQELKAELDSDKLDLASVRQEISAFQRSLYEQEKEVSSIERELSSKLGTSSFPQKRFSTVGWPLDEQGRISSDYGLRIHPIYNEERFHTGVDIAAPTGTPIKAVADGVVITSESLNGYGLSVVIDHGQGLSTFYGHASKLLVEVGKTVRKGQTIALVGSTGLSTGPHIHFEVREDGQHVDPWTWLK